MDTHFSLKKKTRHPNRLRLSFFRRQDQSKEKVQDPFKSLSDILEFYQAVLDLVPQGIFWKDRNMVYLGCNRTFANDAGLNAPEEIRGKSDLDLPWPHEQKEQFRNSDRQVIESGLPFHTLEKVTLPGNQTIWAETNKIPLYDARGAVAGVLGMYRDITMLRYDQENLRESQQRLQAIMDNIPQAIYWKDRASIYQGCNRNFAASAGISSTQDIVGKTDFDLAWAYAQAVWFRLSDQRIMENNRPELHITEYIRRANGNQAWLEMNSLPLHDAMGEVIGILGTFEDITERKRTEEALERARSELERRVAERTTELSQANLLLQQEVAERMALEKIEHEQRTLAEALRDTAEILNSTLNLNEVLDRILNVIGRVVPHDAATIVMIEGEYGRIVRYADSSGKVFDENLVDRKYPMQELALLQMMTASREPLIVEDLAKERLEIASKDFPWVHAYLGCPILSEGEVIGFINLNSASPRFFRQEHADRLLAFANQAATAIQNARLYEQAQALAVMQERQRLARDLHDAVSQTLWTLNLMADVFPAVWEANPEKGRQVLERFRRLTRGALAEMRTLLLELRPASLKQSRLDELIHQLVEAMTSRKKIDVSFAVCGEAFCLPAEVQEALYRVTQEALNNLTKHARATQAQVLLEYDPGGVSLEIRDNGRGFDPQFTSPEHMGLEIMRERANAVAARLEITSATDLGTCILIDWHPDRSR